MEFVSVVAAALASFIFGAVWYSALAGPWKEASGVALDEAGNPANHKDPKPYIIGILASILVAGMMRHVFELSNIDTLGKALTSGFGIGAFLAAPWLATNYGFAGRPAKLILIDSGYAIFGCTVMGAVLAIL